MTPKIKKIIIVFVILEAILCVTFFVSQKIMLQQAIDAAKSGDNEKLESLIGKLANVNAEGSGHETILYVACESGNRQAISIALEHGADPNKQFGYLLTPLEAYCTYGYESGPEALQKLISAGADVNKYINKPAIIVLAYKAYMMDDNQKAIASQEINLLFKSGASLTFGDETVLHYAAKSNMANLVYALIRTEPGLALINTPDAEGNTPYQVAIKYGAVAVQRVIRNYEDEVRKLIEEAQQQETGNDSGLSEEDLINQWLDIEKQNP